MQSNTNSQYSMSTNIIVNLSVVAYIGVTVEGSLPNRAIILLTLRKVKLWWEEITGLGELMEINSENLEMDTVIRKLFTQKMEK